MENIGMRLTIHRGSRQIGGSCVELASDSTRLILDVGLPLNLIDQSALPNVPGLFAPGPRIDAILLSHAHADHSGLIPKTQSDIPIYRTAETSKMLMAGEYFASGKKLPREREKKLTPGVAKRIGDLHVTAFSVGHSALGAVAFLIERGNERLIYSGDLRMHGRERGMPEELVAASRRAPIDVLLMEGTHFSREQKPALSETDLETALVGDIQRSSGLVLAHFSPQHVERLITFDEATKRAGRIFVPDLYSAYVMQLAAPHCAVRNPAYDSSIPVFTPLAQGRRPLVIRERFRPNRITLGKILAEPSRYVMVGRPSMFTQDFERKLPSGSLYLYSLWHGYLDSDEWPPTRAALAACGADFRERHTSGHASAADLVEFARRIDARVVVPIHTDAPEAFKRAVPRTRLLADGEAVSIEEL